MKSAILCGAAMLMCVLAGCSLPGKPKPGPEVPRPQDVMEFKTLYQQNCSACHGADGRNGSAISMANPAYEGLIDDATLHDVIANGQKGTLMPAFGTASGGMLVDAQVDALVKGMRSAWPAANVAAAGAPPYKATHAGDTTHGAQVYQAACARCHGASASQPGKAGSVLDDSFLALVSAQTLRTVVIAGRPDLGQPNWREDIPGHPLTDADVTDVVAWMIAQRSKTPGQPYPVGNSQPKQ